MDTLGEAISKPEVGQQADATSTLYRQNNGGGWSFWTTCDELSRVLEYSLDGGVSWEPLQKLQCDRSNRNAVTLSESKLGGRTLPITVSFRLSGDKGLSESAELTLDQLTPDVSSFSVSADTINGYVSSDVVTIHLHGQFLNTQADRLSPSEMFITQNPDCKNEGVWEKYASKSELTLKSLNGANSVFVKFRDPANNESDCVQTNVIHDSISPVAENFKIVDNNNIVRSSLIDLVLQGNEDVFEMKISPNANCSGSNWESYSISRVGWQVSLLNSTNFVSVRFRDRAHNESQCLSVSYVHDNIPPANPVLQLMFGTSPSRNDSPVIRISGLQIGDVTKMYRDSACLNEIANFNFTGSDVYLNPTLPSNGTYGFYVDVKDVADNQIQCVGPLLTYDFDNVPPTVVGSGHPTSSASGLTSWVENLVIDSGTHYRWKIGPSASTDCNVSVGYSSWVNSLIPLYVDISGQPEESIKFCLLSKDAAGNEQSPATTYSWVKNTILVTAQIVSGQPSSVTNQTSFSLDIGGNTVADYQFKLGASATTDCTQTTDYSGWVTASMNLNLNVSSGASYPDGTYRLCVRGRNSSLVEQDPSAPTTLTWAKDTTPPVTSGSGHPTAAMSYITTWTENLTASQQDYYRWKVGLAAAINCNDEAGYTSWLASTSSFAMDISAVSDGSVVFCLGGRDFAGNVQTTPSSYSWIKNTSSVTASILTPFPAIPSKLTSFTVQIGGDQVAEYKYKVGVASSTDCTAGTGYSASWIAQVNSISLDIAGLADGSIRFCVVGRSAALAEQNLLFATESVWIKDTTPAVPVAVAGPATGTYYTGEDLVLTVEFNEDVYLKPLTSAGGTMTFYVGGVSRNADYYRQSSARKFEYLYRLASGESGAIQHGTNLSLTGEIYDVAGNKLTVSSGLTSTVFSGVTASSQTPTLEWSQTLYRVSEAAGSLILPITLSSAMDRDLVVYYQVDATNAQSGIDYNLNSGSFTIPAGQTTASVTLTLLDNATIETRLRRVLVDLVGGRRGSVNSNKKIVEVLIEDDESSIGRVSDPAVELIAVGSGMCFRTQLGFVYCFGKNTSGNLGNGSSTQNEMLPTRIVGLTNVTDIRKTGSNGVCALGVMAGTTQWYCWGENSYGELGVGNSTDQSTTAARVGVSISATILWNDGSTFFVQDGGQVKGWGYNIYGQLGSGSTSPSVQGTPTTLPNLATVVHVETESNNSCGLFDNDSNSSNGHELKCWGYNTTYSITGTGDLANITAPKSVLSNIFSFSMGFRSSCAIGDFDSNLTNGYELKCWGYNNQGQLGTGDTANHSTPADVSGLHSVIKTEPLGFYSRCALGDFNSSSAGIELACWGYNNSGQIGDGTAISKSSPFIHSLVDVQEMYLATSTACAKVGGGQIYCWGYGFTAGPSLRTASDVAQVLVLDGLVFFRNSSGGLTCEGSLCTPVGTLPSSGVTSIVANSTNICYLVNGGVQCSPLTTATKYFNIPEIISTSFSTVYPSGVTKLSRMSYNSKLAGFCLDFNSSGQLTCSSGGAPILYGINMSSYHGMLKTNLSSDWSTQHNISGSTTCSKDSLNNLMCWGSTHAAAYGIGKVTGEFDNAAIGDTGFSFISANTSNSYSSLSSIGPNIGATPLLTGLSGVARGYYHTCAIESTNGTVKCWPTSATLGNTYGQLGDGTTTQRAVNTVASVLSITGANRIFSGIYRTCALVGSALSCWGTDTGISTGANSTPREMMTSGVLDVQMDGNYLCVKKLDGNQQPAWYCTTNNVIPGTATVTNATDFSVSGGRMCARFDTGELQCMGGMAQEFGRIYDLPPQNVW